MENKNNSKVSHKVGDAIEKVGQKISDMGAPKVGNSIYNSGDKIEHSSDQHKTTNTSTGKL